jgi:hypothetical protein
MGELRPVGSRGGGAVVNFEESAARIRSTRDGRAEAATLALTHGTNLYTDFVMRHGRRPDRKQAATIGRLMGVQVRAADGTMQPLRTKADKKAARAAKDAERTEDDYIDQILKLRCALANLAEIEGDPAVVIRYMDPLFGDASVIREHLAQAVIWINRFAEEWGREQETRGGPGRV